jgi:hypothetical protein
LGELSLSILQPVRLFLWFLIFSFLLTLDVILMLLWFLTMVVVMLIKAEGGVLERIREELEGRRLSSVSTTPRQLGLFGATWHVKTFS